MLKFFIKAIILLLMKLDSNNSQIIFLNSGTYYLVM